MLAQKFTLRLLARCAAGIRDRKILSAYNPGASLKRCRESIMKYGVVGLLALALSACSSQHSVEQGEPPERTESKLEEPLVYDESSIILNEALRSYKEKYTAASIHKAFAQSPNGAWSWKSNRTSRKHAVRNALMACRSNNGKIDVAPAFDHMIGSHRSCVIERLLTRLGIGLEGKQQAHC